jgi:hypothetical protein
MHEAHHWLGYFFLLKYTYSCYVSLASFDGGNQGFASFEKRAGNNFQTPILRKRTDRPLGENLTFLNLNFLANGIDNPASYLS